MLTCRTQWLLALLAVAVLSGSTRADLLFQQNFDAPIVGSIGDDAFTVVSGAATSGSALPRRHDLNDGNQGRLATSNILQFNPTSSSAVAGTTFTYDLHAFTSGTANRVTTLSAIENDTMLMSVGVDMQQQLYINGSTAGSIVVEPNDAFRGLDWTEFTITLNATDWNLTVQRYLPQSGHYNDPQDSTVVTDPSGQPSGISDTYTFSYLNSGLFVSSFRLDGDPNGTTDPLVFYDNFVWEGTAVAFAAPKLQIDRGTGAMAIVNNSGEALDVLGYSILSDSGALDQTGWTTIAGNYDATPANGGTGNGSVDVDDNWTVLTGAGVVTDLSEAELVGGDGGSIAHMQTVELGTPWIANPFGASDITVELLHTDGTISNIDVDFTGIDIVSGDISGADGTPDGSINLIDWLEFKGNLNADVSALSLAQAYQEGDLNGDLVIGPDDYVLFVEAYDGANGAGAFAGLIAGVPEPGSFLLMALGAGLGLCWAGRKRRSAHRKAAMYHAVKTFALFVPFVLAGTGVVQADITIASYDAGPSGGGPTDLNPNLQGWTDMENVLATDPADLGVTANVGPIAPDASGLNAWQVNDNLADSASDAPGYRRTISSGQYDAMFLFGWEYTLTARPISANGGWSSWAVVPGATNPWGITGDERVPGPIRVGDGNSWEYGIVDGTAINLGSDSANEHHTLRLVGEAGATTYSTFVDGVQYGPDGLPGSGSWDFTAGGANSSTRGVVTFMSGSSAGTDRVVNWNSVSLVAATPELTLKVNKTSGGVSLLNNTGESLDFNGYFVTSDDGALDTGGWNSLEDQDHDGNGIPDDGIGWEEFDASDASFLGEGFLTGATTLADQASLPLGSAFDTSVFGSGNDGDLEFEFTIVVGENNVVLPGRVEYFVGDFNEADFDQDGDVDGDDFLLWQTGFGTPSGAVKMDGDFDNDEDVDGDDFLGWQANFGSAGGDGSSAVPEPSTGLLGLLIVGLGGLFSRLRRTGRWTVAVVAIVALSPTLALAATNDRHYQLGDDALEGATEGAIVGTGNTFFATFDSAGGSGSGDFQDLGVIGSPTYVDVSDRPGASNGDLGASFNPASFDQLWTDKSMNAPSQMWDNPNFFGDPTTFPHNYEGIFSHGIQLWAKPNGATQGVLQDVILDTLENGVVITENDTWGLWFDAAGGPAADSGVAVAFDRWTHVMQLGGIRDLVNGGSAFDGALLVNGVAVAARAGAYDPDESLLTIGSSQDNLENFYHGFLDEVRLFFWGDNTGVPDGPSGQQGQDWTALDLNVDNDWIAQELADRGVTDPADVNLDGSVNIDDQTAFVPHWRTVQSVDGVQVGDWNSRQNGDLNYDGIVNLADAFILHEGLLAGGGSGLDFSLLGGAPEPSSGVLLALAMFVLIGGRCRWANQTH